MKIRLFNNADTGDSSVFNLRLRIADSQAGKVELGIAPKIKDLIQAKMLLAEFLDDMYNNYTV